MSDLSKFTEAEKMALDAYITLMRASRSVTINTHGHLADVNLTISQFGVLDALFHLGPLYQSEIAAKILKSVGNLTTVIDNLEKRDLVKRHRLSDDRRRIQVRLTDKGRRLFASIFPNHLAGIVNRFAVLTPEEQVQLKYLCRTLGLDRLEQNEYRPSAP
jgi:MarR family 2-MHQ and catechol resistance regulon transcriptional repressor